VSSSEARDDTEIRGLLSRFPRPSLTAGFGDAVLRRVHEREQVLAQERRVRARLLLGAYWLAAGAASVWILARLPWPEWVVPVAWGLAVAAAPVAYAIALFPERARACLAVGLRPLLPPLEE